MSVTARCFSGMGKSYPPRPSWTRQPTSAKVRCEGVSWFKVTVEQFTKKKRLSVWELVLNFNRSLDKRSFLKLGYESEVL